MGEVVWQGHRESPERKAVDDSLTGLVVQLVAAITRLDPRDIYNADRKGTLAAKARQIAMYLAHTGLDWTQTQTGEAFGRDRSTVAHACSRVEDWREDPAFDRRLSGLEAWLQALPREGELL